MAVTVDAEVVKAAAEAMAVVMEGAMEGAVEAVKGVVKAAEAVAVPMEEVVVKVKVVDCAVATEVEGGGSAVDLAEVAMKAWVVEQGGIHPVVWVEEAEEVVVVAEIMGEVMAAGVMEVVA
ncbi:hypothetical protein CYMTET_53609 [Cymbomonas tetramitiformis]|uniref:Uncharacterized protein n=1 Tax=Cymbomonas tetramitiformis TaxID=36881 RepID=A0AAE0BGW0_9CHLO|nr:hypothetical protein CYMTET_53609 [Cymbomonas tetramitiformis]